MKIGQHELVVLHFTKGSSVLKNYKNLGFPKDVKGLTSVKFIIGLNNDKGTRICEIMYCGISYCNPKDTFTKKIGVQVALAKINSVLPAKYKKAFSSDVEKLLNSNTKKAQSNETDKN